MEVWQRNNMYDTNTKDIIAAQSGDKDAMNKIVENNVGLIWSIVKRFNGRGYELEDIYQIGAMGFIKAIKRFDTNFEVKLSTYAVPYILGEIKRFIRDDGPVKVSRSIKELGIKIRELQRENISKTGEEISISDIVKKLKVSKEDVVLALDSMNPVESIYAENSGDSDGGISLIDRISTNKDEALSIIDNISLKQLIDGLEQKEKEIIMLRYYKEKTQSQVAKILGVSQVQVSRIEKKILNSMKMKLIV